VERLTTKLLACQILRCIPRLYICII
jgi:hypothetical protein